MRYLSLLVGLFVLGLGEMAANGIVACDLNGTSLALGQCYSSGTLFVTPVTVDWGTAYGPADTSSGANPNPHDVTSPSASWNATVGGMSLSLNVSGDFTSFSSGSAQLARVDNTNYLWDATSSQWVLASTQDPNLLAYGSHFGAPSAPGSGTGDHLVDVYNGTGSLVISFGQGVSSAGLLVDTQSASSNIDFNASITALDSNGAVLGIYGITTQGVGGRCAGLYTFSTSPQPCNDAPFIGIQAPGNRQSIYSLVINTTVGGSDSQPLLDSLMYEESGIPDIPEPSTAVLLGGGFLALTLLRGRFTTRP